MTCPDGGYEDDWPDDEPTPDPTAGDWDAPDPDWAVTIRTTGDRL